MSGEIGFLMGWKRVCMVCDWGYSTRGSR